MGSTDSEGRHRDGERGSAARAWREDPVLRLGERQPGAAGFPSTVRARSEVPSAASAYRPRSSRCTSSRQRTSCPRVLDLRRRVRQTGGGARVPIGCCSMRRPASLGSRPASGFGAGRLEPRSTLSSQLHGEQAADGDDPGASVVPPAHPALDLALHPGPGRSPAVRTAARAARHSARSRRRSARSSSAATASCRSVQRRLPAGRHGAPPRPRARCLRDRGSAPRRHGARGNRAAAARSGRTPTQASSDTQARPGSRRLSRGGDTACERSGGIRGPRGCRSGWWRGPHGRASPARRAGRRRLRAGGSRSCAAACAG